MRRKLALLAVAAFLPACSSPSAPAQDATAAATAQASGPPHVSEVFTPVPCRPGTTIGMEGCAEHSVLRSDVVINRDLQMLWRGATNDAARSHLAAAQQAWQDYRKAECLSESDAYAGGTLSTVVAARCMARMSAARAAELTRQRRSSPGG